REHLRVEFERKKKRNFTRILRLKKRRRTQAKKLEQIQIFIGCFLMKKTGKLVFTQNQEVEIEFPVSLGLLVKSVNFESRQIQIQKSIVRRLYAIFQSKVAVREESSRGTIRLLRFWFLRDETISQGGSCQNALALRSSHEMVELRISFEKNRVSREFQPSHRF
uniref:Uncharacterized protein n=1 Tax=Cucumis melo TaxID=3656 RepID=A0A9I9EJU4_CUCME